jgi:GDP-L-fucose synthase
MQAAHRFGSKRLLYLASACIYPRECRQPMRPEDLWSGPLEPTSRGYASAKLAALELCQALASQHGAPFVAAIPANPFGPGEDVSPETGHVVGALLARMHEAKQRGAPEVVVWGSGRARRDFLYVEDLAEACMLVMERYSGSGSVNLSAGCDIAIGELAERIRKVVGFDGEVRFDASRPDGAPAKLLDGSALRALGWQPRTPLDDALAETYRWLRTRSSGRSSGA